AMTKSWTTWSRAFPEIKESKLQKDMRTVSVVIIPIINPGLGKVGLSNAGPATRSDLLYRLCLLKMRPV
ncbi:unnamed protein product, partial [marine sediment metagenome]